MVVYGNGVAVEERCGLGCTDINRGSSTLGKNGQIEIPSLADIISDLPLFAKIISKIPLFWNSSS